MYREPIHLTIELMHIFFNILYNAVEINIYVNIYFIYVYTLLQSKQGDLNLKMYIYLYF